ncbi:MAG: hypothetical protein GOVbin1923_44 [Prokaryotic dsDNA virus sp.]|nr:MAG: hypothetical protein GOVbin1923_44 [Prokaryotic dsDNA virus sp.]|tara:strand:+ start:4141 stop:4431 length:291 start_codon:yes stop_codon:yes gene_type:complete
MMGEEIEGLPEGTYHWGRNHHIWTYCIYLGTIKHDGHYYDLGVFPGGSRGPSHATVSGKDFHEYSSGDLASFQMGAVKKETIRRWKQYLKLIGGEE